MKYLLFFGVITLVFFVYLLVSEKEMSIDGFTSTFSHCIDVYNGEVYGVGLSKNSQKKMYWVSFQGADIVSATPYSGAKTKEAFPTRCWLDKNMQMHFVWASHGVERVVSPRRSDTLHHAMYNFNLDTWTDPVLVWGAPKGTTFNWSYSDGPPLIHSEEDVYTVFEVSDYRFAIIKWVASQQDWKVNFLESVDFVLSNGYKSTAGMAGYPSFGVSPDGRFYIAYMTDYEIEWGSNAEYAIYLIQSNDNGMTWSEPVHVVQTSMPGPKRPDLWVSGDTLHVLWYERDFGEWEKPGRFGHTYSDDAGSSWSMPYYFSPSGGYTLERELCSDVNGNRYLIAGSLQPRPMDYFAWMDRGWTKGIDISTYLAEPEFSGLINPVVACDSQAAYVYATPIRSLNSELSHPGSSYRFLARLDSVRTVATAK